MEECPWADGCDCCSEAGPLSSGQAANPCIGGCGYRRVQWLSVSGVRGTSNGWDHGIEGCHCGRGGSTQRDRQCHEPLTWACLVYSNPAGTLLEKPGTLLQADAIIAVFTGQALARHGRHCLGGVSETSPRDAPSKQDDNSTKPGLNHVQSTTREPSPYGDLDLRPRSQNCAAKKPSEKSSSKEGDDTDDTGSSLAESVHIETASTSNSDSSDKNEGGGIKVPTG